MVTIKCVSLPVKLQNRHDNFFIPFIIPLYKGKPGQDVIDHYLGLVVDIFLCGWETGIHLSKTAKEKTGHNVHFALVYILGDLKVWVKVAGVQDHTVHWCRGICDCEGLDTHGRFNYTDWNILTLEDIKHHAKIWQEAPIRKALQKGIQKTWCP
jgi:hypothetical protein